MLVGVPKEIKVHEYRVGLTPSSVREMAMHNHEVLVQTGCRHRHRCERRRLSARRCADRGKRRRCIQARRDDHQGQGAAGDRARDAARGADSVYLPAPGAGSRADGRSVEERRDLHRVRDRDRTSGGLPLLAPMSEVAGRLAVQAGARCLEKSAGGMGMLLGGVAGVAPGRIVILGAGMVGTMRHKWPSALVRRWSSSTARSTRCAGSMRCSTRA